MLEDNGPMSHGNLEATNNNVVATFEDLYNYIKNAKKDIYGYHVIGKSIALNIYCKRRQLSICTMHEFKGWISTINIKFNQDDKTIQVHTVGEDGSIDYNNWKDYKFNDVLDILIGNTNNPLVIRRVEDIIKFLIGRK
jgi:hypothetical protein